MAKGKRRELVLSRVIDCPDRDYEMLISVPVLFNLFDNMAMKIQQLTLPQQSIAPHTGSVAASTGFNTVETDVKVIALVKGKERYVFIYNESNRPEVLRLLGRYASNPELSFTWYDAAVLSQKIRQEGLQQARERQRTELSPCDVSLPVDELF